MTAEDVYTLIINRSNRTYNLILIASIIVIVLILVQIVAKVILFRRMIRIGDATVVLLKKVERYLGMVERHAELNEIQKERMQQTLAAMKEKAEQQVTVAFSIPERVKEAVHEVMEAVEGKSGVIRTIPEGTPVAMPPGTKFTAETT